MGFLSLGFVQAVSQQKYVHETFRGTRIINGHSVETPVGGGLEFLISHRFGVLSGGFYELFGLDQASVRFGLEYGVNDWLNVGFGRSSHGKHYDGFIKARLLNPRLIFTMPPRINTKATKDLPVIRRMGRSCTIAVACIAMRQAGSPITSWIIQISASGTWKR